MAQHAAEIARHLLPQGKKASGEWKAGNTSGETGDSLSVRLTGAKAGVWKDFASGEGGDLLDLWMACHGLTLIEAMKEAKQFLGIREDFPKPPERTFTKPAKPQTQKPVGPVYAWLRGRGLTDQTIEAFKVREVQRNGSTWALFPYLRDGEYVNGKYRNPDDKKGMGQEKDAMPCLFGWHLISPNVRVVTICEGEIDAMTLHQCRIPALSVNAGAGNHQWIESDWERLERFEEIIVWFDNDEPGKKGATEVVRRLGIERCRIVHHAAKDANQWLQDGADASDLQQAIEEARPLDPDELTSADDHTAEVEALFYPDPEAPKDPSLFIDKYLDWFQFRRGEYTAWTGWNGHGKSLMLDQVLLGLMKQGEQVVIFSGELTPARHLKRVHKQASGLDRPSIPYIRAIGAWLRDRCWIFDVVGSAKLDRLLEVFAYAARRHGVRHFVIDSLMMIDVPVDGPGSLSAQKAAVQKICDFAKRHGAHVHLVAHPRKGKDEARPPTKMDVAGSGDIINAADNTFAVWRNKKDEALPSADDPEAVEKWKKKQEEPDAELVLSKNRHGDFQDYTLALWFDKASQQYRTQPRRYPLSFVEFSTQEPTYAGYDQSPEAPSAR
ncbi:hypothetical protein A8M77_14505 [Variovorax sp. JS1663]|nr:hypothetical protein A8M77_14505 [Variovorax sp. JS1663]